MQGLSKHEKEGAFSFFLILVIIMITSTLVILLAWYDYDNMNLAQTAAIDRENAINALTIMDQNRHE